MTSIKNIKNHVPYLFAQDVAEICSPLFKAFNLNYFDYVRVYPDDSCLVLVSDKNWYQYYTEKKFPFSGNIVTSGVNLWHDYYAPEECVYAQANVFNHCNGVTIFTQNPDYIEYFDLAAPRDNANIFNFYLNQTSLLNQFLFYFKSKATKLIRIANQERIFSSQHHQNVVFTDKTIQSFYKRMQEAKVTMNFYNRDVTLTCREYECLLHLAQGQTMKEIARHLNISPKTVEDHLTHAKIKTGCPSKMQLIQTFIKNFVHTLITS